jgi:hypothetical protein
MEEQTIRGMSTSLSRSPLIKQGLAIASGILLVVAAVLPGMLSFIPALDEPSLLLIKAGQAVAFLVMGIVYTWLLYRYAPMVKAGSLKRVWRYSLLMAALIYGALELLYYSASGNYPLMSLASVCAFSLPFIITQAWFYFNRLAGDDHEPAGREDRPEVAENLPVISNPSPAGAKYPVAEKADPSHRQQSSYYSRDHRKQDARDHYERKLKEMEIRQRREYEAQLAVEVKALENRLNQEYEHRLRQELDRLQMEEAARYTARLAIELEKMRAEKNSPHEGELAHEPGSVPTTDRQQYENRWADELEKARSQTPREHELKLAGEIHVIQARTAEEYDRRSAAEMEHWIKEQEQVNEVRLNRQLYELREREKYTYEQRLSKELEQVRARESAMFETRLESELMRLRNQQAKKQALLIEELQALKRKLLNPGGFPDMADTQAEDLAGAKGSGG